MDSIGILKADKPNYTSVLYPVGTKGMQYLQIKVKIPASGFMKQQSGMLILSVCLMLVLILCVVYQLIVIRQKNERLIKREIATNGIINDMKAPLNSINTTLSWFKTKTEDTSIKESIETNQAIVRHMIHNIESLLVTARKDKQGMIINKTKINLPAMVEMVKEELSSLYKGKFNSIDIINNLPNNYRVNADLLYIENAIRNLVENSLKYSDDDVSIRITLMIVDKAVQISVKDNGWGIAPEHQKKVFTQFYQVPRRKIKKREGFGIGLAQVKYIVDEHGGNVTVKSTENKGSVFVFTIPVS